MKVLVVGANGQIGSHLTKLLSESNAYSVKAMIRHKDQEKFFEQMGVETVLADLEGTVDEITDAVRDCDAIVFTAGSGGKTGYDQTLLIDLDGAVKTIEAAEKSGVKRFIMISAHQAHIRENWNPSIRPYYAAKHYADRILRQSKLNYTIIRPGGLLNEKGTGNVTAAENLERGSMPREDVALTIFKALDEKNTFRRSFDLISGDTAIEEALKEF